MRAPAASQDPPALPPSELPEDEEELQPRTKKTNDSAACRMCMSVHSAMTVPIGIVHTNSAPQPRSCAAACEPCDADHLQVQVARTCMRVDAPSLETTDFDAQK
jgi:hypothetical protein